MEKTFTTLPNELIATDGIKLDHVIVYLMCKSHMNNETRKCYPSLTTLSKKCKIGRVQVISYLKDLEDAGYIKITHATKKGQSNYYEFPVDKEEKFEMISTALLNNPDLNAKEKTYLAILQKYLIINKDERTGKYRLSSREISEITKTPIWTINKLAKGLCDKGMLERFQTNVKDQVTQLYKNETLTHLDKTKQADILLAEDINSIKCMMVAMFGQVFKEIKSIKQSQENNSTINLKNIPL